MENRVRRIIGTAALGFSVFACAVTTLIDMMRPELAIPIGLTSLGLYVFGGLTLFGPKPSTVKKLIGLK